jgi:hypothetical protein
MTEDPVITGYMDQFSSSEQLQKVEEALKVGILAIRAAGPTLDASVVDRSFRDAEVRIKAVVDGAEKYLKNLLDSVMQSAFGDRGQVQSLLDRYFTDKGLVGSLVGKLVGPGSDFFKSIDPKNRDGVLAQIEKALQDHLSGAMDAVVRQFSLDNEDGAIARLKKTLDDQMKTVRDSIIDLVGAVQRVTGKDEGKAEEAEKGAGKGMVFEDDLYVALASQAKGFGDLSESTQGTTGTIPRSKVGDAIVTVGSKFSSAPGERIVFEFKKDRGYKFKDALDEVATARRNRNAQIGVMVFAKGYEPPEIGDFRVMGMEDAVFCTADPEDMAAGVIHMEAAYGVARGLLVAMKKTEGGVSVEALKAQIEGISSLAERLAEITTKAQTVRNAGDAINDLVAKIQADLRQRVHAMQDMIAGAAHGTA